MSQQTATSESLTRIFLRNSEEGCRNFDECDAIFQTKETGVVDIHHKVDIFPVGLAEVCAETEQTLQAKLNPRFNFTKEPSEKEIERELKLAEQKIYVLESKVKEQSQLVAQTDQRADIVTNQTQLIACRALDASAQKCGQVYQKEKKRKTERRDI